MQDTIPRTALPPLVDALVTLLAAHRPAFRQDRTYHRSCALVVAFLWTFARHTLTQCLLALGLIDADWTAFYRLFSHRRMDIPTLQLCFFRQTLRHSPPSEPYVVAADGVTFPRSSRRMPGVGWRKAPNTAPFRPGLALGQRFGALYWLPPLEHGFTRAIPLWSYPLFTPKATPAAMPPQREWTGALLALHTLRHALDASGRFAQPILFLADGSYDVVDFWRELPARTIVVVRTARNRVLRDLPVTSPGQRGRRRRYGPVAPKPADWLQERRGWQTSTQEVRGQARTMRYRVEGPFLRERVSDQPLYLVLMGGQHYRRGQRRKYKEPVPVLVSAMQQADGRASLPLPLEALLVWLWQRWEVEVAHRELKSGFGVGEMQCWHPASVSSTIQWGIWVYGVCLLAAYRCWGICGGPQPPGRWRPRAARWSFSTLWRSLRSSWWDVPEFQRLVSRTPSDWTKKEVCFHGFCNAVTGSTRL